MKMLKKVLKWIGVAAILLIAAGWLLWQDVLVWSITHTPYVGVALELLGSAEHPRAHVVLRLARMLNPTAKRSEAYENVAILTTLGRMGPAAAAAIPAVRALPKGQWGRAEALERLGAPEPNDTAERAFAEVHQKARLPIHRGWIGAMSHVDRPLAAIIRDDAEWHTLWRMHAGAGSTPPKVDFPKENVLAFFPGPDFSIVGLHFDEFTQYTSSAVAVFGYANSDMVWYWPSSPFVIAVVDPPLGELIVRTHHGWFMGDGPVDETFARFPSK